MDEGRKDTILALSERTNSRLLELRCVLGEMTDRTSPPAETSECKSQVPNVLDEIITNQEEALKRIVEIGVVVVTEIRNRLL